MSVPTHLRWLPQLAHTVSVLESSVREREAQTVEFVRCLSGLRGQVAKTLEAHGEVEAAVEGLRAVARDVRVRLAKLDAEAEPAVAAAGELLQARLKKFVAGVHVLAVVVMTFGVIAVSQDGAQAVAARAGTQSPQQRSRKCAAR